MAGDLKLIGRFVAWQPRYAKHNIPTFPVEVNADGKKPLTRGYLNTGLRGSAALTIKFPHAQSFGFACGEMSGITVVDMDSVDPEIIHEAEGIFGPSPLHWRTGGGKYAAAYRWNGEERLIRPMPGLPIDLLGGGFVVAPPSAGAMRCYEIIRGSLEDIDRLPAALIPDEIASRRAKALIPTGKRNKELFEYCRQIVSSCDDYDQLLSAARYWASCRLDSPLPDAEVVRTCWSVWNYQGGRKSVWGQIVERDIFDRLLRDVDALAVLTYLRAENGPNAEFMITDTMGKKFGWPRRRVPTARRILLELGIVTRVRRHGKGVAALYRWKALSDY